MSLHPYLNIAVKAARKAGQTMTRAIEQLNRMETTNKFTQLDCIIRTHVTAKRDILIEIKKAYPRHTIIGDESGQKRDSKNNNNVTWIINTLDGIINFIHNFPHFAISISIYRKGIIEHGLVYDPIKNELFTATKGSGAQLDGRKIRVSTCQHISHAILATGFKHRQQKIPTKTYLETYKFLLENSANIRCTGVTSLDLAYIAANRIDGLFELGLHASNIAAGDLLIREAGGFITDFSGKNKYLRSGKVIAGNPKIHSELFKILQS